MRVILQNPTIDIHVIEKNTGVNSFWLAAFYGHGEIMNMLAEAGIDIMNRHKKTLNNVLHTACDRQYPHIVQQLVDSGYPLNVKKSEGLTALVSACIDDNEQISKILIKGKANLNIVTDKGSSALSEAVVKNNKKLTWLLLTQGAHMIYKDPKIIHLSPFYKAIDNDSIWAVELFADHGADLSGIGSVSSQNPLIYAAINGMDDMCMYLSLRASNVDIEDNEGNNIFNMYLKKEDKLRCM